MQKMDTCSECQLILPLFFCILCDTCFCQVCLVKHNDLHRQTANLTEAALKIQAESPTGLVH